MKTISCSRNQGKIGKRYLVYQAANGYNVLRTGGERRLWSIRRADCFVRLLNEQEQELNEEILSEFHTPDLKIYKQKLTQILSNPFYCGLIANKMLNGKLVESTHEN